MMTWDEQWDEQWDSMLRMDIIGMGMFDHQSSSGQKVRGKMCNMRNWQQSDKNFLLNAVNDNLDDYGYTITDHNIQYLCIFNTVTLCSNLNTLKRMLEMFEFKSNRKNGEIDVFNRVIRIRVVMNINLDIVKYVFENFKSNDKSDNVQILRIACKRNENLEVIKYLVEEQKMDATCCDDENMSYLQHTCRSNSNLDIIKYLINDQKNDPHHTDKRGNQCLYYAYIFNQDIDIVRYLIEEQNVDTHKMRLSILCSPDLAKYTIEETNICILDMRVPENSGSWHCEVIEKLTRKNKRVSEFINSCTQHFTAEQLIMCKNSLNPFLIDPVDRKICYCNQNDPMKLTFRDYKKLVDEMECQIEGCIDDKYDGYDIDPNDRNETNDCDEYDFTKPSEPLFECNGEIYHGHREIIYDQIECFKEIKDVACFREIPVLNSMAPKYLINMWIRSMYGNHTFGQHSFNLHKIQINDIEQFLYLIEHYQTTHINTRSLDAQIMEYFESHPEFDINDTKNQWLREYCQRNEMKHLYVHLHNVSIQNMGINDFTQ
jgi:hypothetical protein